jgi:hypothetical protein
MRPSVHPTIPPKKKKNFSKKRKNHYKCKHKRKKKQAYAGCVSGGLLSFPTVFLTGQTPTQNKDHLSQSPHS